MLEEKRPKSWLKSVSAFANGMGGSLFFGVSNNRNVMGLKDTQHVMETISLLLRDRMDPLPDVELIPILTDNKNSGTAKGRGREVHTLLLCGRWAKGGFRAHRR